MSEHIVKSYPEATAAPCSECPWRKKALPGYLGPHSAEVWAEIAHSEGVVACHKTIRNTDDEGLGDWSHPAMRQCRGLASFRANVCKLPRRDDVAVGPPNQEVFANAFDFIEHHQRR